MAKKEFFPLTATLMASTIFSLSVSSSIVETVQNKPVFSNLLMHLHTIDFFPRLFQ
jgi:hypothetical protein